MHKTFRLKSPGQIGWLKWKDTMFQRGKQQWNLMRVCSSKPVSLCLGTPVPILLTKQSIEIEVPSG